MEGPTAAERRDLARLERRAIAAYERDLLAELQEAAVVEAVCTALAIHPDGLGSVELQLASRHLFMLGVAQRACVELVALAGSATVRIVAAGRYDKHWWVNLSTGYRHAVVLSMRAYLGPNQGGIRVAQVA